MRKFSTVPNTENKFYCFSIYIYYTELVSVAQGDKGK